MGRRAPPPPRPLPPTIDREDVAAAELATQIQVLDRGQRRDEPEILMDEVQRPRGLRLANALTVRPRHRDLGAVGDSTQSNGAVASIAALRIVGI